MFTAGCFSYKARPIAGLVQGDPIVASLNDAGRAAVATALGDSIARAEGVFASSDAVGVRMYVNDVVFLSESSAPRSNIMVTLPNSAIDSVSTKKLEKLSSLWFVAALGAATFVLSKIIKVQPTL